MKHQALCILEDLIRIQSVNPHFGENAQGEMQVSEYIEAYCKKAGLAVSRQTVSPGRDNLVIELKTGHPESVLLFEAHMDTVSLGSMRDPLQPHYVGDRLYGRGACDTKGSLAAMIYALEQCAKQPEKMNSDLILCASVDEEYAFQGLLKFLELDLPISAAVVGEPTQLKIVVSHKGCVRFAVNTHGKAAHSSVPDEGINAIEQMAKVISHISGNLGPRLATMVDPLCGPATVSIGVIRGGKQINIVPDHCSIQVDRRIIPGEEPERVLREIEKEFQEAFSSQGISWSIDELLLDWALNTPHQNPLVLTSRQIAANLGLPDGIYGETYGTNASKLQGIKNIPTIVYGPGSIAQAHSSEEWVSVEEVKQASQFYLQLAQAYHKDFPTGVAESSI